MTTINTTGSFDQRIDAEFDDMISMRIENGLPNYDNWLRHSLLNPWRTYAKPISIVDIDGVLYNWCDSYSNTLVRMGVVERSRRIDWTEHHAYRQLINEDTYRTFHAEHADEIYGSHLQVEFGLAAELARLHEITAIAFVTARPTTVYEQTVEFLNSLMGARPYLLEFSTDKTSVERLAPIAAIDDGVKHIHEYADVASLRLIALRSAAYNRGEVSVFVNDNRVRRVEWFGQFVDMVDEVVWEATSAGLPDDAFDFGGGEHPPLDFIIDPE